MSHSSGLTPTMPASSSSIASTRKLQDMFEAFETSGMHIGITFRAPTLPCSRIPCLLLSKSSLRRTTAAPHAPHAHPCTLIHAMLSCYASEPFYPMQHRSSFSHAMHAMHTGERSPMLHMLASTPCTPAPSPMEVEPSVQVQPLDEQAAQRAVHLRIHAVCRHGCRKESSA